VLGPDVELLGDENVGDRGLDVLAHIPLGDDVRGRFVVFAQAACTESWVTKQFSASPAAWKNLLTLAVPQVNVCAIPHSFRRVGGDWHDVGKIGETLLLDRSRLLTLVDEGLEELADAIVSTEETLEHVRAVIAYTDRP
jgi:hypothetical protein